MSTATQEIRPTEFPRSRLADGTAADPHPIATLIAAMGRLGRALDPDAASRDRARARIAAALAA